MNIYESFENFISYIKHEENLSVNTVKAYHRDVSSFLDYLAKQKIENVKDINTLNIRSYLLTIHNKLDKVSVSRITSSIRSFLRYLNLQGLIKIDVLTKVLSPKIPKKLMFSLSIEEVNKFFSIIDTSTDLGKRNLAILELLYATGIRVTELVNIKLSDIDFKEKIIKVLGKGRKERIVPFNIEAFNAINNYLNIRNNFVYADKPNNSLFLNKSGSTLSQRSIQRILKFISLKSGILKNATPHTMRHSYATHLIEAGASIKTVKELLGHASINATERYTHITVEKLAEIYKKTHPKA